MCSTGVYATMFGFYLHVLRKHGVMQYRFLTGATISLFLLCTAHCALLLATTEIANVINGSTELSRQSLQIYVSLNRASNTIYVTSKCVYLLHWVWSLSLTSPVQSQIGFL
jgi:hypothetical protein